MLREKKDNKKEDKRGKSLVAKFFVNILLASTLLSGCGQEEATPIIIHSEDSLQGNPSYISNFQSEGSNVLRLGNGIYYNSENSGGSLNLHYFDIPTQKDIILCNKPECKHDGNEFCVATNSKYRPIAFQAYSGSIFATAYCMDEEKLEFKLLRVAPDGSSLSEIATYYSTTSTNIESVQAELKAGSTLDRYGYNFLLIHRNKAYLPFCFHPENTDDDVNVFGLTELDLDTKEMKSVFEEVASQENTPWFNVSARGDFLYYVTEEPHKYRLHRRSLLDSSDEVLTLLTYFTGEYAVYDDTHIAYLRSIHDLAIYDLTDGSNEEISLITDKDYTTYTKEVSYEEPMDENDPEKGYQIVFRTKVTGGGFEKVTPYNYTPAALSTDGTYLYAVQMAHKAYVGDEVYGKEYYCRIHVFNADLEEIVVAIIPNPMYLINTNMSYSANMEVYGLGVSIDYVGDEVYLTYNKNVFSCSMEDFLTGEPDFTLVFQKQYKKGENPYEK